MKLIAGQLLQAYREWPRVSRELSAFPADRPVFITGAYRSGTTWFARMLSIPGVWYLHEPFNPNKGLWKENFSYVEGNGRHEDIDRIMDGLLSLSLRAGPSAPVLHRPRADHRLMPARIFTPQVNRILIKDPLACLMSEYLTRTKMLQTIVLFRHPAGFAASLKGLDWPAARELKRMLENRKLMKNWLEPYREIMEKFCGSERIDAAAALHGCLNKVLWGYVSRNENMAQAIFEDYCASPIEKFRDLFHDLGLPYDENVKEMHSRYSMVGKKGRDDFRPHDVKRNSLDMAYRWRRLIDAGEVARVRSIWENFDIPLYRSEEDWKAESG